MLKKNMEKFIRYSFTVMVCFVLVVSCKTSQTPNTINNPAQTIKVSLYSIGTGIDAKAEGVVQFTIDKYQKKGLDLTYIVHHWGREGEKNYCINAEKLKVDDYKQLLNDLKTDLKDLQVHIYESQPCVE